MAKNYIRKCYQCGFKGRRIELPAIGRFYIRCPKCKKRGSYEARPIRKQTLVKLMLLKQNIDYKSSIRGIKEKGMQEEHYIVGHTHKIINGKRFRLEARSFKRNIEESAKRLRKAGYLVRIQFYKGSYQMWVGSRRTKKTRQQFLLPLGIGVADCYL